MKGHQLFLRTSVRGLFASYLKAFPRWIVWISLGVVWMARSTTTAGSGIMGMVGAVLAAEIAIPLVVWMTTKYCITSGAVSRLSGIVVRQTVTIEWKEVKAVSESADWSQRLFKVSTITLKTETYSDLSLTIQGLDSDAVLDFYDRYTPDSGVIENRSRRKGNKESVQTVTMGNNLQRMPQVIYRVSIREILAIGLMNGKAFLYAPSALLIVWGVIEDAGGTHSLLSFMAAWPRPLQAVAISAIGIIAGTVMVFIKFHKYKIAVSGTDKIIISYGLLETKTRTVGRSAVYGTLLTSNLLEQVLRRTRMRLYAADSKPRSEGDIVLPPLTTHQLKQICRVLLVPEGMPHLPKGRRNILGVTVRMIVLIASGVFGCLGGWWLFQNWGRGLALIPMSILLSLIIATALMRLASTKVCLQLDEKTLAIKTTWPDSRIVIYGARNLHGISSRDYLPSARFGLVLTISAFAGGVIRHRILRASRCDVDRLRQAMIKEQTMPQKKYTLSKTR